MTNIVKLFAQAWILEKKVADLPTQKLIIEFADEIDKMLEMSMTYRKDGNEN